MNKIFIPKSKVFKSQQDVVDTVREMKRVNAGVRDFFLSRSTYNSLLTVEKKYVEEYNKTINVEEYLKTTKLPLLKERKEQIRSNPNSLKKKSCFNRDDFGDIEVLDVALRFE